MATHDRYTLSPLPYNSSWLPFKFKLPFEQLITKENISPGLFVSLFHALLFTFKVVRSKCLFVCFFFFFLVWDLNLPLLLLGLYSVCFFFFFFFSFFNIYIYIYIYWLFSSMVHSFVMHILQSVNFERGKQGLFYICTPVFNLSNHRHGTFI